ncbi:MAG TPA: ArsA family ATPase [Solirubrobacteraceae bacterium]|jgi:anion-transporting  ArsA/GET3 family ATPase
MGSMIERKLIVVTGKGGVGKTTVAASLGLAATRRGLRAIVVELGGQQSLAAMFGARGDPDAGGEIELSDGLWGTSLDPDRALADWLGTLTGRLSARMIGSRATFQYFVAAAPGAKELLSMIKVWELTQQQRWRGAQRSYDLVILDAPATGHALGLLRSPHTFEAIARVGPVAAQTQKVRELLADRQRTAYLAVARPAEMAVTETLELAAGLPEQLGRELEAVIVNGVLRRRFTNGELGRLAGVDGDRALAAAALAAAREVNERTRIQRNQLARLRRRELRAVTVPFLFTARIELEHIQSIAERLERRL